MPERSGAESQSPALLQEALTALHRFDRPDLAWLAVEAVLERDPADIMALAVASLVARRLGRIDLAVDLAARAVLIAPDEPVVNRAYAEALAEANRPDEAICALERALAVEPDDGASQLQLASMVLATGRTADAERAFRRAADLRPEDSASRKALILFDLAAGRYKEVERRYRELLRIDGQEPAEHLVVAGPFRSVKEWCEESGSRYEVVAPAVPALLFPPQFFPDPAPDPIPVIRPELYVAEIPQATVVGGEAMIVTSTGELLWDLATLPNAERFELAERVTRYAENGRALVDVHPPEPQRPCLDRAIHLTGVSSFNYYHFLVDVVARLAGMGAAGSEWEMAPVLVDSGAMAVPQLARALEIAIGAGHDVITLHPGAAQSVGRLLVLSPVSWLPNNTRGDLVEPTDALLSAEMVEFLRHRLPPPDVTMREHGSRRVCIVRRKTGRLQNGPELARVAAEFGFETVAPETLSLDDQIRLFADADVILAETGAGLTNILFAPSHARVVVLMGDRWRASVFSQIAGLLGQSMTYVVGRLVQAHRVIYQSGYEIDADDLRLALHSILGERAVPPPPPSAPKPSGRRSPATHTAP